MASGRNDPCPCGSGRKYKHCCGLPDSTIVDVDRATNRARVAAASSRVWEVEAVPLLIGFDEGTAHRPVMILVTADGMVAHHDLRTRLSGEMEAVASALEKSVTKTARDCGSYPEEVRIRHEEVAAALRAKLGPRQVTVTVRDRLPDLEAAARSLMAELTEGEMWPPPCRPETWAGWGLPAPLVTRLFEAAASFWTAAPWRTASNFQAPKVTLPSGREWTACILGNGGEEFGLALYSDANDLFERAALADPVDGFAYVLGRMVSVAFESLAEISPRARREVMERRWKLASTDAYPSLLTVNTPGGGVTRAQIEDLVLLLRAVPTFVAKHAKLLGHENATGASAPLIEWRDGETGAWFRYAGEAATSPAGSPDAFGGDLRGVIDEAFDGALEEVGPDSDGLLGALQARLRGANEAYNASPQTDLGDLSPNQVRRLLERDWNGPDAAVVLRRDLLAVDLDGVDVLFNIRALLRLALEKGGRLGATQAGNLQVAVVGELIARARLGPVAEYLREAVRPPREGEVSRIHLVRIMSELAGMMRRRGARFELGPRGRELQAEERAGELYALLFETWFRRFNLGYLGTAEWPELQHQMAFTLYRLSSLEADWRLPRDILATAVLPFARERAPRNPHLDLPSVLLEQRCLGPLADFGLLERRHPLRSESLKDSASAYRVTRLFREFLSFRL